MRLMLATVESTYRLVVVSLKQTWQTVRAGLFVGRKALMMHRLALLRNLSLLHRHLSRRCHRASDQAATLVPRSRGILHLGHRGREPIL